MPQEVVLAVQLFDSGIDGFECGDVCLHFFPAQLRRGSFLEDAFQFFAQADGFRVFLVEVARQPFTDFAHDVFQIVGKFEFGFADFDELEVNVFQRFIEQMAVSPCCSFSARFKVSRRAAVSRYKRLSLSKPDAQEIRGCLAGAERCIALLEVCRVF